MRWHASSASVVPGPAVDDVVAGQPSAMSDSSPSVTSPTLHSARAESQPHAPLHRRGQVMRSQRSGAREVGARVVAVGVSAPSVPAAVADLLVVMGLPVPWACGGET